MTTPQIWAQIPFIYKAFKLTSPKHPIVFARGTCRDQLMDVVAVWAAFGRHCARSIVFRELVVEALFQGCFGNRGCPARVLFLCVARPGSCLGGGTRISEL